MIRTEQELDNELAQMTEEVPPMPADFHERWMNAIRNEQSRQGGNRETEDAGENARQKIVSVNRWTRILSIAAVFVFLTGGTVLYRNSKKSMNTVLHAEEKAPAAVPAAEEVITDGAAEDTDAGAGFLLQMNASNSAAAAPKAASGNAVPAPAEEADLVYEAAEEEAEALAYEEAADSAVMAAPAETMLPAESSDVPEEHTTEAEGGFLQDAGGFLADMGDFLLAALPYLAVLAVPAVIALAIRRKKK